MTRISNQLGRPHCAALRADWLKAISALVGFAGRLNFLEKLKNRKVECTGDNFQGIKRRVGLAPLKATKVCLVEAATFTKNDLTHSAF